MLGCAEPARSTLLLVRLRVAVPYPVRKADLLLGKGLHSSDGVAKLKPAIEELLQE